MKRAASIGKGTKYDFTREHKDKNANFYEKPSDFDPKTTSSPRWTFGISRSKYDKVYYETNKTIDTSVPGPGKYYMPKSFGEDAQKFSIRGKLKDISLENANKYPGPGEYPIMAINPTGKYYDSKFKNATNIMFGASKSQRFNYMGKVAMCNNLVSSYPGPQHYQVKSLIDGTGKNYCSKFSSSPAKTLVGKPKDFLDKYASKIVKLIFSSWSW